MTLNGPVPYRLCAPLQTAMIQAKGCRIIISVVSMEGAEQTRGPAYLEPEAFQAEGLGFRTFTYSLAPDFRFASCLCFENQRHSILSS